MGLFTTSYNHKLYDIVLLLLRITAGCTMMTHGLPKLAKLMGDGPLEFADPLNVGAQASLILVVFAEVVCSFLIIMGFATRLATVPLIITMLVAIFIVHSTDAFDNKELPVLYLAIYVLLGVTGSGRYSVDQLISGRKKKIHY